MRSLEYRVLDDRLFLLNSREWTYFSADQPEFDENAGLAKRSYSPDGTTVLSDEPQGRRGGSSREHTTTDVSGLYRALPSFPDWAEFAEVSATLVLEDPPQESAEPPWRPSAPLAAEGIESAFTSGTRWKLHDRVVTTEVVEAGTLRMPSGQVAVSDPGWLDGHVKPFTVTVAPGEYRVDLGLVRFEANPEHVRVTAAKLVVSNAQVVSWEPALTAGQDARVLGADEYYGFGVDAGAGCFFDAAALGAFEQLLDEDGFEDLLIDPLGDDDLAVVTDPESGATLVAYSSGWGDGSYPTWIGRTATGEVACFVSDMLILRYATPADEEVLMS
ncbi:DUF4241 domain-containing protein [Lentzea sp. NPDC003310]|uniref:DUF4241 domain-containing protein n=1 Tax=Lentzea sp. NPDC003310 TaxID=3154447 RepID=UPI0033BAB324